MLNNLPTRRGGRQRVYNQAKDQSRLEGVRRRRRHVDLVIIPQPGKYHLGTKKEEDNPVPKCRLRIGAASL